MFLLQMLTCQKRMIHKSDVNQLKPIYDDHQSLTINVQIVKSFD